MHHILFECFSNSVLMLGCLLLSPAPQDVSPCCTTMGESIITWYKQVWSITTIFCFLLTESGALTVPVAMSTQYLRGEYHSRPTPFRITAHTGIRTTVRAIKAYNQIGAICLKQRHSIMQCVNKIELLCKLWIIIHPFNRDSDFCRLPCSTIVEVA